MFYKELIAKYKIKRTVCLVAEDFGRLTIKQLKALKQAINKRIKRKGRVLFNLCAFLPITKKPLEIRMGKGKGNANTRDVRIMPFFMQKHDWRLKQKFYYNKNMSYLVYPTSKFKEKFISLLEKKCKSYKYKKSLVRNNKNVSLDVFENIVTTNLNKTPGFSLNLKTTMYQNSLYKNLFFFIHTETSSNQNILFNAKNFINQFISIANGFFLYPNKNGILIFAAGLLGFVSLKDLKTKKSFLLQINKIQEKENFFLILYQISNNEKKNIVSLKTAINFLNPINVKRFLKKKKNIKIAEVKPFLEFIFI